MDTKNFPISSVTSVLTPADQTYRRAWLAYRNQVLDAWQHPRPEDFTPKARSALDAAKRKLDKCRIAARVPERKGPIEPLIPPRLRSSAFGFTLGACIELPPPQTPEEKEAQNEKLIQLHYEDQQRHAGLKEIWGAQDEREREEHASEKRIRESLERGHSTGPLKDFIRKAKRNLGRGVKDAMVIAKEADSLREAKKVPFHRVCTPGMKGSNSLVEALLDPNSHGLTKRFISGVKF